jgi:hypothetical protein
LGCFHDQTFLISFFHCNKLSVLIIQPSTAFLGLLSVLPQSSSFLLPFLPSANKICRWRRRVRRLPAVSVEYC